VPGAELDPAALCVALDELLPGDRCLVLDSGHFMAWPAMLWRGAGTFLFGQAFQAVGLGLARAIGAAVARPDRVTVAMVGDGGAMMGLAELDTAARLRLPLLVVVFDDAAYGAEVHDFRPLGVRVDAAQFPDRDIAGVARALGCTAYALRTLDELSMVRDWAARLDGPLVIDAKIDPHADAVKLMTPLGAADWSPAPRTGGAT
jgi:thiamine pyrophosphate-dependent acetolactate synthase large subunit-like protein